MAVVTGTLAAIGLAKAGYGMYQNYKANKMEDKLVRPKAVSEAERAVSAQKGQMALGGIAGESEARKDIQRSTANTVASLGQSTASSSKLLEAIQGTQAKEGSLTQGLNVDLAKQRQGLMEKYLQSKQQIGEKEVIDKQNKFEAEASAISRMKTAGAKNIEAGVTDVAGAYLRNTGSSPDDVIERGKGGNSSAMLKYKGGKGGQFGKPFKGLNRTSFLKK